MSSPVGKDSACLALFHSDTNPHAPAGRFDPKERPARSFEHSVVPEAEVLHEAKPLIAQTQER